MAGFDSSKVLLKGQWNLASGLVNGQNYCLLPNGAFSPQLNDNPLSVSSAASLANVGIRDGNGLYHLPSDARHAYLGYATLNAMAGVVGCTLSIWASSAQPWTTRCAAFGNPSPLTLSNGASAALLMPTIPSSLLTVSGGTGQVAAEWILVTVTATTWPSSGGILDLILASY